MADNNKYTESVIITTVKSADLGRTHGPWDYVILPEAFDIATRGQVIVIYGSGNNPDSDLNRYSITSTKDGGMVSIGGNYYEVRDLQGLYGGTLYPYDLDEDTWKALLNTKTTSEFTSFTTVLDLDYFNDYIEDDGKIRKIEAGLGVGPIMSKYKSPSQYNLYHLSVNNNVVTGAVNFTGSGKLVLTAQNGGRYSQYYDSLSSLSAGDPEYSLKQDDGIALRSDNYGFTTRYRTFQGNGTLSSASVDSTASPWPSYSWTPFNYEGQSPARPGQTIENYTINAAKTLNVVSDLAGKIQSNTAAFISSYCVRYDTQSGEYIWDLDTSNYTIVNAGVKADALVLDSNFRAQMTSVNNRELFRAKFGYSRASGDRAAVVAGNLVNVNGSNYYWDVYDPTVAYVTKDKVKVPGNPTLGHGGYWDKETWKHISVYGMVAGGVRLTQSDIAAMESDGYNTNRTFGGGTSVGGGTKADNVKIESHGIYVNNLQTSTRVGKWVKNEYKDEDELEYVSWKASNWAGQIIADTSNALIMADTRYLGYISNSTYENALKTLVTVNNSSIGAYGVRADGILHIAAMGNISLDKDNVLQTVENIQSPSITVTASDNSIWAYHPELDMTQVNSSTTVTASALYANTMYLGASRIAGENGGYLKDKSGRELVLNTGGVSSDVTLTVNAYRNDIESYNEIGWEQNYANDYSLERIYGIYAEKGYFGGFAGEITINSDHVWATGIHVDNLYSVDSMSGSITHDMGVGDDAGIGINSKNLTVKGVIDTEITAGMGINIQQGGVMDIDAFTGKIIASRSGINIYSTAQDVTNIAGTISVATSDRDTTLYGITSFDALNLRISGTISAKNSSDPYRNYAVMGEAYRIITRADDDGWTTLGRNTSNQSLLVDYVELASTAKITGNIDLGAGRNNMVINSSAEFVGIVGSDGGTLNLSFELDEGRIDSARPTMTITSFSDHDATTKDTSTFTINLNYAVAGKYTLLQYEFNASQYWAAKPELISLRYQDETKEVYLQPDGSGNAQAKITMDSGVEVTLDFISDLTANVSTFSVSLDKSMPKAPAISTQTTVDDFVKDLVYAEDGAKNITLNWETLDRYVREQFSAETLQDVHGRKFEQFTGYTVVYALRGVDGAQVGDQYTISVSSKNDAEAVLSLDSMALLTGVPASNISSAKIISITANGKDNKGKAVETTFNFSQITGEFEEEKRLMSFDWSKQAADWKVLLQNSKLTTEQGHPLSGIDFYNVTFEFYTKLGMRMEFDYTINDVDVDTPECKLDLQAVVDASNGMINSWTDIGYVVLSNIELVDSDKNISVDRNFSYVSQPWEQAENDLRVSLDWSEHAADWKNLVASSALLDSTTGKKFSEITGYDLVLSVISNLNHGEIGRVVYHVDDPDALNANISLENLIEKYGLTIKPEVIKSLEIKEIRVLGKTESRDDKGNLIYDSEGNITYEDVSNSYIFTDHNNKSELKADGMVFNWSIMDADLNEKIRRGQLPLFPVDALTHTNIYDVTFRVTIKDGTLLTFAENDINDFKKELSFNYVAGKLGIKSDDIVDIEVVSIDANIKYEIVEGDQTVSKIYEVLYDYPETTNVSVCSNIAASFTIQELQASGAVLVPGTNPADIAQCELTYELKNSRGEVIGTVSGVKGDVDASGNVNMSLDLVQVAEQLKIDVNDITSVELKEVNALGAETEINVADDVSATNKTTKDLAPGGAVWRLDWSDLNAAINQSKATGTKLAFLEEIVNPTDFVIQYHVELADGTIYRAGKELTVSCNETGYELTWEYLLSNVITPGANIDIEAIAAAQNVGLSQAVTVVIDKFTVTGTNSEGTFRREELVGMANDVKVSNVTSAVQADIVKLDCTEFEQYLIDNSLAASVGTVTYTYKLRGGENNLSISSEVVSIRDRVDNTQTVTFNSAAEGKLYLKDNEYLLADSVIRPDNDDVKGLTVESINVDGTDYDTVLFDKFERKIAIEWQAEAFAGKAATYIAEYVVVDKNGKLYGNYTVEGTGTSAEITNLDEIAGKNKVGVETLAVELVSVKVKIDDPANGCSAEWKAVSATNSSNVASTVVTFNLYGENGVKLGELTKTLTGAYDNGTLEAADLYAWATANGKPVADIKQIEFKSVEYKDASGKVLESALGIGEQSLLGPYCTLDWSQLVGNVPAGCKEYTVTYKISGTDKDGSITVKEGEAAFNAKQYQLAMGAGDKEVSISKIEYKIENADPQTVKLSSSTIRYHVEWDVEGDPLAQTVINVYFVDENNNVIGGTAYEKTLTTAVEDCYITQEDIDEFAQANKVSDSDKAKIVGVQLKSAVNSDPAQPTEPEKTAGTYIYAITGEGENRALAAGWQASLQAIYTGATWQTGVEHELTYQYIFRDKDGKVIGDPVPWTITIPSGGNAKDVFDKLTVANLPADAVELVLIDVVANSGIDITKHPAGTDGKSHLGDYVANGALYFDFEGFAFQNNDEITLKLYDAEGKQVGNEIVATYKAGENFWTAVNDDYVESGATTVVIDEVIRNGQVVYEKEMKSALLYHDIWLDKLTAAPVAGAEYNVTYVFRDKDGKVVGGNQTAAYKYDGSKTSAADFAGLSDDDRAKVTQIQILKVEDKSVPGTFVYDITDDDIFMDLSWEAIELPTGVGVTNITYNVIYALKEASGNILKWYRNEDLTEQYLRFNISKAVENDLPGRTDEDVASVEIVAVEVNGKDGSGNDIKEIYAGFESKAKEDEPYDSKNPEDKIIELNWADWYSSVYNHAGKYALDDTANYFRITYQAVDTLGKVIGTEQITLKTTFHNYYVDMEQLAAKLSAQLGKTIAIADICEVKLTQIEVLDNNLAVIPEYTYKGYQQSVSSEFTAVGFTLNWESDHEKFMKDIADDGKLDSSNIASFDHYVISYVIKDAAGNTLDTVTGQQVAAGACTHFVNTNNYTAAASVEITELKICGREGIYTDVNLKKEFAAGNHIVLDWSKEQGVSQLPSAKQTYNLTLTLIKSNGGSQTITITNVSGTNYAVNLADLAAVYGFAATDVTQIVFDEIKIIENSAAVSTVKIGKTSILNSGQTSALLDWAKIAAELQGKIKGGILMDAQGNPITDIAKYKISYIVLDASGNPLAGYPKTLELNGDVSSYLVPLNEPNATSARLTKLEVFDSTGKSCQYSWTEAVSVVGHFVENYNEIDKTLTISWYGLDPADYNLDMISQYEVEYKLYDEKGQMGDGSIAFKCPGDVTEYTINGIENTTNVEWRIRVLGDNTNGKVSAWSNWQSAKPAIMAQSVDLFDLSEFSSNVVEANPSKDTTGVVDAVAQLSWDGIASKNPIRNYIVEYCELPLQLRLKDMALGVPLKDFVASNDGKGLFQTATDSQGNALIDRFGNEYTIAKYLDENNIEQQVEVYTKTLTGENLSISQFQNQSYVYWRIKAVDSENNESDWMAGDTFRIWTFQDDGKPEFTNLKSDTLDINFPGMTVLAPEETVIKNSNEDTTYEALLGWNEAFDTDSGVQSYVIEMKGNNGHSMTFEVNNEDQIAYSCAHWTSVDLEMDGIYAVRIMDNAGNWIKLKDADGVDQDYLTDVRLQKYNDTSFTLSWYTQTDFTGMNAAVFKKNLETNVWEPVLGYQDAAQTRPVLVDNMVYNRFDYAFKVSGLQDRVYDYRIMAKDYFNNTTEISKSATGQLIADATVPLFTEDDEVTFKSSDSSYIPESNLEKPVLLNGSLYWTAASDSESLVRKYIVRFMPSNSSEFSNVDEFSVMQLQDRQTVLDFTDTGIEIKKGESYEVTVNGMLLDGLFTAQEDGVLRLDTYIANISSVSISDKVSVYPVHDVSALKIRVFEMQSTNIKDLSGEYTGNCIVDFNDGTAPVTVKAEKGSVWIDRNLMYQNVKIIAEDGVTVLFNGLVTDENAKLYYRVDSLELGEDLAAGAYRYEVTAVDYFGQESRVISSSFEADMEAPVFNENVKPNEASTVPDKQTAVSGFIFHLPTALPGVNGSASTPASYSAWLGWVSASDGDGSGVRSYTVEYSTEVNDNGNPIWQPINIAVDDLYGKSTARWQSDKLVNGKTYRVFVNDNAYDVTAVDNTIAWTVTDYNLKGMAVRIYEAEPGKKENELKQVAVITGAKETEPATGDQYRYNFISGKTFEAWTLASNGNEGSLNASDVYKVTVDGVECISAMREINGKVWLTWAVDGNDKSGRVVIEQETRNEENKVVYTEVFDSVKHANSSKFVLNKNYYECVYELPGISNEKLQYRISAEDFYNNSTINEGTSLVGSLVVDSGKPKFSNVTVDCGQVINRVDPGSNKKVEKMQPSFSWTPATDAPGDMGVWYYELYIEQPVIHEENGVKEERLEFVKHKVALDSELQAWYKSGKETPFYTVPDEGLLDWAEYRYKIVAYDYFGNYTEKIDYFGSNDTIPPTGFFQDLPEGLNNSIVKANWQSVTGVVRWEEGDNGEQIAVTETKRGQLTEASVKLFWKWEQDRNSDDIDKGVKYCVTVDNGGQGDSKISYDFWTDGEKYIVDGVEYTAITFDNSTPGRSVGIFEGWDKVCWSVQVFDKAYNGGSNIDNAQLNTQLKSPTYEFSFTADYKGTETPIDNYVDWVFIETEDGEMLVNNRQRVEMENKPQIVNVEYIWDEVGKVEYAWAANKVDARRDSTVEISWTHDEEVLGVYSYIITLDNGVNKYEASTIAANVKGAGTDMASVVKFENGKFTISDLREFFNLYGTEPLHDIHDGNYKLTITACDTNGGKNTNGEYAACRKKVSDSVDVIIDTTLPERVENKHLDIKSIADNVGSEKYVIPVISLSCPDEDIVSYEVWYHYANILDPVVTDWFMKSVKEADRDPKTGLLSVELPSVSENTAYKFQIVAIDALGNRSQASDERTTLKGANDLVDTVLEALTPVKDEKGNDYYPARVVWDNNRYTVNESVGYRDGGDTFFIHENKSCAVTLTLSELSLLKGKTDDIKIEVYKVDPVTNKAKSWKVFTAKDDGRITNDLLLDGNTTYVFRVVAADHKNSVPEYKLTVDKKNIGGSGNDSADDNLASILGLEAKDQAKYITELPVRAGGTLNENGNWVGYGDFSDIKILKFNSTGRYTFSLKNVAAQAVLTVYEVVQKVNARGEIKTSYQKVTSVTANQTKLDGVTSKEVVLEEGKTYFYEVKIGNKLLVGTEYKVDITCIDSYPKATAYDNLLAADKTKFAGQTLELNKELTEDNDKAALWVGAGDKVDYFMLTADSGKTLAAGELYQLKLDGIEGSNIKVAIGYLDAKGQFKQIMSKTGAKNAEALIMHCNFTYEHLSKGQLYVQVSANGKNGNSRYTMSMTPYTALTNNTDDMAEITQKVLKYDGKIKELELKDWVGFGDNTDFVKLELTTDGLYQFSVSEVANNVTVDVLKKVVAASGEIKYIKVDSLRATASKNAVDGKLLLLDASEEYYVSVTAPGANRGNNSDYKLVMEMVDNGSVDLGKIAIDQPYAFVAKPTLAALTAQNYVYTAAELGGAYEFTLKNTEATGSVKLTVYELLDNGNKRTVKSITVKAGAEGSTGYLWLDDDVVKNGTGIYQVEIKGTGKKVEGKVEYSVNGYGFAQYLTEIAVDDKNNVLKVTDPAKPGEMTANKDWVGMGDASDSYKYTVNNVGVHEFTLEGINGNNIKLTILDASGKVLKSFTGANKADFASFAYEFKATGDYTILVEAAGKNKFSEYKLSAYDRVSDAAKLDDTTVMLGNAKAWDKSDKSKLVLVKDEDPAKAVNTDVTGWVGAGDAKDFYGIVINESGNYDLNIGNLENNVKVTLYEATAWNTFDNSIKSGKVVKSVTATADGIASLSGFYLNKDKDYYVVVQATSTNGSKNTAYTLDLEATRTIGGALISEKASKNAPDAYTFTAINGAYDVTLTLEDGDRAVVTLYKVNPVNGKYIKVKSVTATSKNATVNTGDLSLEADFSYVVEVTAPNAKNGAEIAYKLSLNHWSFQASSSAVNSNNKNDNDLTTVNVLSIDGNNYSVQAATDAVWRVGNDKAAWDAVDYYKVEVNESGSYSLKLDGTNGNTVRVTIGTMNTNGQFRAVQSVTGQAGSTELMLSRKLDANVYYVKVESITNNTGSEYTLELAHNEKRKGFSTEDNTWKQVAGDIDAVTYNTAKNIEDWVGFGDAVDVFKIRLEDIDEKIGSNNGQVVFKGIGATADALIDKEIKLSLVDANGRSVALTFDKESGIYTSKNILMAGADYYLTVKNSNEKKQNIDYQIDINLA